MELDMKNIWFSVPLGKCRTEKLTDFFYRGPNGNTPARMPKRHERNQDHEKKPQIGAWTPNAESIENWATLTPVCSRTDNKPDSPA
jgi:hypothetical protein